MQESHPGQPDIRTYIRTFALAAVIGVPVSLAAVALTTIINDLIDFVWKDIPDAANYDSPPWWYVLLIPTVGGVLVSAALRLPGRGGHPGVYGLSMEPPSLVDLPWILGAAVSTLTSGLVLGPEAPLLQLGLGFGLAAARTARFEASEHQVMVFAGAFAAISTLFGGPLVSALMLFELASRSTKLSGTAVANLLMPGFVAAGVGAVIFTGVAGWPGVHEGSFSVSGLPAYETLRLRDTAWCIPIALAVAASVSLCRGTAIRLYEDLPAPREAVLVVGGLLVGVIAITFRAVSGEPVDLVLFSGEESLSAIAALDAAGIVLLLVAAKGVAYTLSLGAGFRGGPVFPAIAIGVAAGVFASLAFPGLALTPAVAAGAAAGGAAVLRMPIFGALMASLLFGADLAPIAVVSAAVAWLAATALDAQKVQGEA